MEGRKEEFYERVKRLRIIASDPEYQKCSCPKTACEWHGKCVECVTLHRYAKKHIPNCLQQFVNEKIKAIADIGELETTEKEKTPEDYWVYIKEQDKKMDKRWAWICSHQF